MAIETWLVITDVNGLVHDIRIKSNPKLLPKHVYPMVHKEKYEELLETARQMLLVMRELSDHDLTQHLDKLVNEFEEEDFDDAEAT